MTGAELTAIPDAEYFTLTDTLDLAIILYTDDINEIPSSEGVAINYDANVKNQNAIPGTDYEWDHPASDTVRFKALVAGNYKVRVV